MAFAITFGPQPPFWRFYNKISFPPFLFISNPRSIKKILHPIEKFTFSAFFLKKKIANNLNPSLTSRPLGPLLIWWLTARPTLSSNLSVFFDREKEIWISILILKAITANVFLVWTQTEKPFLLILWNVWKQISEEGETERWEGTEIYFSARFLNSGVLKTTVQ